MIDELTTYKTNFIELRQKKIITAFSRLWVLFLKKSMLVLRKERKNCHAPKWRCMQFNDEDMKKKWKETTWTYTQTNENWTKARRTNNKVVCCHQQRRLKQKTRKYKSSSSRQRNYSNLYIQTNKERRKNNKQVSIKFSSVFVRFLHCIYNWSTQLHFSFLFCLT